MLESFYEYLIKDILVGYFKENPAVKGSRYYIIIEDQKNRENFVNAIQQYAKPIEISDIYQGNNVPVNEEPYSTYELEFSADLPKLIIGYDKTSTEDYLTTIRNTVGLPGSKYENYGVLFILSDSVLSSLITACKDLQSVGLPLNEKYIIQNIRKSSDILTKDLELVYLNKHLDKIAEDISDGICDLFDFKNALTILNEKGLKGHYNDLGFFNDKSVYDTGFVPSEKEMKHRVELNQEYFSKISSIMNEDDDVDKMALFEKFLDDYATKRILSSKNWKEIDFQQIFVGVENKMKTANLEFLKERLVDDEINCSYVSSFTGKRNKRSVNYYILCDNSGAIAQKMELIFNKEISKSENKKNNNLANKSFKLKGQSVLVNIENELVSFSIGIVDNHHDFYFKRIPCKKSFFKSLNGNFKINKLGQISITLPDDLECLRFGEGKEIIHLPLDNKIVWDNDYCLEIPINEDEEKIQFSIDFNGNIVPFILKISAEKPNPPLRPGNIDHEKNYHGVEFNGSPFGKVSDGENEYAVYSYWRGFLEWEYLFIKNKCNYINIAQNELTGEYIPECSSLDLPIKVSQALDSIYNYFINKNTIPSLSIIDKELEHLYTDYWRAIVDTVKAIPTDRSLSKQEYNLTKLGVISTWDKIYFSPFHPILIAFILEYNNIYDNKENASFASKLLNPFYLIPYLYFNSNTMRPYSDSQLKEIDNWLCYEGVNSKQQERTNDITTKMIWTKMQAFISHFPYLFQDKDCPIIISTIGISDDINVIKGIIEFIKRQYLKGVQKIELHEYVNNLIEETFFEKLNRLDSVDSIMRELERINVSIESKSEYTSQEIVHELFTRVSFYKHSLKECNGQIDYCHIAFYQMDSGDEYITPNTDEARVELSLGGLISIPSTYFKTDAYILGFGTKGLKDPKGFIYPMAIAMNNLYSNEKNEGSNMYQDHKCISKKYKFTSSSLLNSIYDNANWVTFINPEVDIDFFYKQKDLYVVHYTDQYTINAKYDSITVTKHIDQYKNMLRKSYLKYSFSEESFLRFNKTMLSYFNCLNGSWMLNIVNRTEDQIREKMSIVATCITMLKFMKRNRNVIWIPISLEEILRVTGSIGLPMNSIFTKKTLGVKGEMSDDLLMMGLDASDPDNLELYLYPVEVKFSKYFSMAEKGSQQVITTYSQMKEHLYGEPTFVKKIYRTFFASQFLTSAEKYNANGLLNSDEYKIIQEHRFDLLNLKYNIFEDLPIKEMGNAAIVAFYSNASHSIITSKINDVSVCEIHFSEKECFQFVSDPSDCSMSFLENSNIIVNENSEDKSLLTNQNLSNESSIIEISDVIEDILVADTKPENSLDNENVFSTFNTRDPENIKYNQGLQIELGSTPSGRKKLVFEANNIHLVSHPNMGIVGTMGTGKTQLARSIIAQFAKETKHNVGGNPIGLLVFDYKGDYKDDEFLNTVNGKCYRFNYPFNPLKLVISKDVESMNLPAITADRISDSFAKAYGLGLKQQSNIKQVIIETYNDFGITRDPKTWNMSVPTINNVIDKYFDTYDANDKAFALFDKLNDYTIFTTDNNSCVSLFEWLKGVRVIDLTLYPDDTKKVIVSLILDLFYAEMRQMGESKLVNDYREIRAMIMVDEAHQFLKKDFSSLRNIISEGRMFGVGMILSTQNLCDFKTAKEDYSQYILSWIIHHVNNITKNEIASVFGTNDQNYETYMAYISHAQLFESLCKLGSDVEGIRDLPYFELVKNDDRFSKERE